jgi:hypothetical protein
MMMRASPLTAQRELQLRHGHSDAKRTSAKSVAQKNGGGKNRRRRGALLQR